MLSPGSSCKVRSKAISGKEGKGSSWHTCPCLLRRFQLMAAFLQLRQLALQSDLGLLQLGTAQAEGLPLLLLPMVLVTISWLLLLCKAAWASQPSLPTAGLGSHAKDRGSATRLSSQLWVLLKAVKPTSAGSWRRCSGWCGQRCWQGDAGSSWLIALWEQQIVFICSVAQCSSMSRASRGSDAVCFVAKSQLAAQKNSMHKASSARTRKDVRRSGWPRGGHWRRSGRHLGRSMRPGGAAGAAGTAQRADL